MNNGADKLVKYSKYINIAGLLRWWR